MRAQRTHHRVKKSGHLSSKNQQLSSPRRVPRLSPAFCHSKPKRGGAGFERGEKKGLPPIRTYSRPGPRLLVNKLLRIRAQTTSSLPAQTDSSGATASGAFVSAAASRAVYGWSDQDQPFSSSQGLDGWSCRRACQSSLCGVHANCVERSFE